MDTARRIGQPRRMAAGSRRQFLLGAAGLAAAYLALRMGADALYRWRRGEAALVPMARPAGFRRLAGGAMSAGRADPFAGIDAIGTPPPVPLPAIADPCAALYGPVPDGAVPIAVFTDVNCPVCRRDLPLLTRLGSEPGLTVTWHDWPVFGETSELGARAILAAGRQGDAAGMRAALTGSPLRIGDPHVAGTADALGLDAGRLAFDLDDPRIAARLRRTEALADLLGLVGTPSLVVGRTVVDGALSEDRLRALIARERADGPVPGCGA